MVLGTTRSPKLPSKPLIHPSCPAARSVVDLQVHHRKERPREFSRLVHPHSLLVHIASLFASDFRGRDSSNQPFLSKETLCFFSSGVSPRDRNAHSGCRAQV